MNRDLSDLQATPSGTLSIFHPEIRRWFTDTYTAPTDVQIASWPRIAAGSHVLITAPTGSGKTLTAFLWCINRFYTGEWETGRTRVLYVSPLKALNNDIRVNLTEPISTLQSDYGMRPVRTGLRSGDTPSGDRQRLLKHPPDILITTPESLHLMLTTNKGRLALATVECVIVDEIHGLVNNRRGAQLAVGLERLANIAGEFQRISLSATVHPLDAVARWIAGSDATGAGRNIEIINAGQSKQIALAVSFPQEAKAAINNGQKIWEPLAREFRNIIHGNRSTLFFTNSRRLAEKITLKINEQADTPLAFAHHGSLARDIRAEVEQRLKQGELRAIVATSSLEMGIDIGALDEVVMVQTPPSVASTLQRIGRAGHTVGAVSNGRLFPSHSHDLLLAAVLAGAVRERDIEPIVPLHNPLDILVQVIISICATETWSLDRLFDLITRAAVYATLERTIFDLVIDMLSGRFAGSRLRELKPRLIVDRDAGTATVAKGALYAMYSSGGSIPDRGYYKLRAESGTPIGELDEEFVWEATLGQTFTFGTQAWTIQRITHNDVFVKPAGVSDKATPFWRSETFLRGNHFSERIGRFLEQAQTRLEVHEAEDLQREISALGFDESGAVALVEYLQNQRQRTGAPLPHRQHLLIEFAMGGPDGYRGPDDPKQVILHTFWGGALNQPFGMALRAALVDLGVERPDVQADDDAVVIQCREWPEPGTLASLVRSDNLDTLLRRSLESSGLFGARFRECAQRSLLLARPRINQRLPLWMTRMHAKKLLTEVRRYDDFPVLLETWRTCLEDEFDLPALRDRLDEIANGALLWTEVHTTAPSPFATHLRFDQISTYMYDNDDPEVAGASNLSTDLIGSAVRNAALRPVLTADVIATFESKRQRLAPGYLPASLDDLIEWVKERIAVPAPEWSRLLELSSLNHPDDSRLASLQRGERRWVIHRDFLSTLEHLPTDPATPPFNPQQLAIEILSFYGPMTRQRIEAVLPDVDDRLWSDPRLVGDVRVEASADLHFCDRENLDILLRLQRSANRRAVVTLPIRRWPALMARHQGLGSMPTNDRHQLRLDVIDVLARLSGCTAPVDVWLNDLVQARCGEAGARMLDDILATEGFSWRGAGREKIKMTTVDEALLFAGLSEPLSADRQELLRSFSDPSARYSFARIRDQHAASIGAFNQRWWDAVWAGLITADEWSVLRDASRRGFVLDDLTAFGPSVRTLRLRPRTTPVGWPGNWSIASQPADESALERLETERQRIRILLDRYGVLCREIILREGLVWSTGFRALRIMELAGEVIGGLFFEGLSGPQFATPAAVQRLREPAASRSWWINAMDPASPAGLGLDWPELPRRVASSWLAFTGEELALIAEQGGKVLRFLISPDDGRMPDALALVRHLIESRGRLALTRINDVEAIASPFLPPLDQYFDVYRDHRNVELTLR
jgi:ATP-dependent Lhr-like helicase